MLQWNRIHRTEVVKSDFNPQFKPYTTTTEADLHGRTLTTIRISCYDWDIANPKGELVGCVKRKRREKNQETRNNTKNEKQSGSSVYVCVV
jgi:hypothetical protein